MEYATQKNEQYHAQRENSGADPRSARAVLSRQGRRGAGGPDGSGPFPRGPQRNQPERGHPSRRESPGDGPARGEASRRGSFGREVAQGRSAQHGYDRSNSSRGGFDGGAGQRGGIFSLRPFPCEFPGSAPAEREFAGRQRERRKILRRGPGRGDFARDGLDRRGPFWRGPLHNAAAAGLSAGAGREEERLIAVMAKVSAAW